MFFRKKKVEHHAKNIDKFVTTLLIGGAVASMIGLSKTKKGQKVTHDAKDIAIRSAKTGYSMFGKIVLQAIKLVRKK